MSDASTWLDSNGTALSTARLGAAFSTYLDTGAVYLNYATAELAIPEPSTIALLALGLAAFALHRRLRRSGGGGSSQV